MIMESKKARSAHQHYYCCAPPSWTWRIMDGVMGLSSIELLKIDELMAGWLQIK